MDTAAYRWHCACCGREQVGLPLDVAFDPPVRRSEVDAGAAVEADDDFCLVRHPDGTVDRFIRCILPMRVAELDDEFCFGVWISVSEASWEVYQAGFVSGEYEREGCFGYLMHEIPDFPGSLSLECNVSFQPGGDRPRVSVKTGHPLQAAQSEGVTLEQVERWVSPLVRH